MESIFDIATAGVFSGCYLAEVVSVNDPEHHSRVQVRLLNASGLDDHDGPTWARVAVPFAGANRGAFLLPDVGDEVLVAFLQGDARNPIVIGGLWNGRAQAPETLGGSGERVDRWTLVGKNGTRIAIVEESSGQETISLTTPGQVSGTLTASSGGKIEFKIPGTTITLDTSGVAIKTGMKVQVQAGTQVEVSCPQVNVNAAMANFSGIVKCDVLQATTVIASTYTPGAGNIW
jgi:uncharacterized protein involved in type VI secretion and phage assembly